MILKPQNYNCPTVTTLIYLGHLLKVREIPGVSGINGDLIFKSNLNIPMILSAIKLAFLLPILSSLLILKTIFNT